MSKRDRFAYAALGLITGLGLSLFFYAWAVPGFRDPTYSQVGQPHAQSPAEGQKQPIESAEWWDVLTTPEDTYAQWLMAFFSIIATGVSIWAVRLVGSTLDATREVGRDQSRAYVHIDRVELRWGDDSGTKPRFTLIAKNMGQTPAKWFECRSVVFSRPLAEDGSVAEKRTFSDLDNTFGEAVPWTALSANGELSFDAGGDMAVARGTYRKPGVSLEIAGVLRYATFFDEVFESQFWFLTRYVTRFQQKPPESRGVRFVIISEQPHPLQRASGRLEVYKLADDQG